MASSSRGRSKAQMSFGKILDTISSSASTSASISQNSSGKSAQGKDHEKVEKRGLLNIDLNVAPPEDDGSESPKNGGNGEQIQAEVVAAASEEKVISGDGHELNFNGIADEVSEEKSESGNGNQAHWSKGERNGLDVLGEQAKRIESEEEREEKERRERRWNALLEVANIALCEYEENHRNKEEKVQNRKRGVSREIELGGGSGGVRKATTKKKVTVRGSQSFGEERNDEVAAAAEEEEMLAPPLVVRSTRSRAVAMPNKYRDSVLGGAVAEVEFHRHNRSGKSAAVVSTKRKSR